MRYTLLAVLALVPPAFAQRGAHPSGSYGNILHPGVPSPGALRAPSPMPRTGGGRIGGGRIGGGHRSFDGGASYVPFPIYGYGSGFDNFYPGGSPSVFN